jgi:hypothetical protein
VDRIGIPDEALIVSLRGQFDFAVQPSRVAIGQTPTMAPIERPSTLLARVRSYLDAVRAAVLGYLGGEKPTSPDGGTGGAVG